MKTMLALTRLKRLRVCGWLAACTVGATALGAQQPAPRIQAEVSSSEVTVLKGSQHPLAQAQYDAGRMPADTRFTGMTIVFSRSEAQQAALDALLAAQQNPSSPFFHQWLTPDQFAAQFGMAQSDIEKVQTWLEQQGFSIDSVGRSKNMIHFSGTVGQVERAFQTQMHYYNVDGEKRFASSTELSLPTAIASTVVAIRDLDNFRPRFMHTRASARPSFTSGQTGSVYFAPGDIKIAYDMNPLLNGATPIDGAGQSIVITGQSAIAVGDIEAFQTAASLPVMDPTQVLVPSTGSSVVVPGDEGESDLDLEWSGAMATGADIIFVYTGNSTNNGGVFDSIAYSVDQKLGNIISASYGACEATGTGAGTVYGISQTQATALDMSMSQAAAQGQTVVAAAGDSGSTACYIGSSTTPPALSLQQVLAVNYPASSAFVTGIGGTEISSTNAAYMTAGSAYWSGNPTPPAGGVPDIDPSALQYLPEVVWNDSVLSFQNGGGLSATGGGASAFFSKPPWQTGVPGIPADSKRDVPDVSLYSSPNSVGYLFCTSDQTNWNMGQTASCSNGSGFRDANTGALTVAGGTSFATPIFAGMIAIINQAKGYVSGQGLMNTSLYTLAANSGTYATAFHDITSGNNECPSSLGSSFCTGPATSSYAAGAGYDLATGLGSVDLNNLVNATGWPAATKLIGTTTTVAASTPSPAINTQVTFTITVAPQTGSAMPTGSVTISVDGAGTPYGTGSTTSVALGANGTAIYQTTFTTAGNHQVVAQFAGDTTFAGSAGVASVNVPAPSTPGTFTMSATNISVSQGAMGTSTITVTPAGGYKGTINILPSASNASFCYSATQAVVSGTIAVTSTLTIDTNLLDCQGASIKSHGMRLFSAGGRKAQTIPRSAPSIMRSAIGIAGIFFAGLIGWRFRRSRLVASMIVLGMLGFVLSGCGGGGSSNNNNDTPKGTYTVTLTGQDSTTSTITANTNMTLTVN
jgi:subtilase family serine protease